MTEKEKQAETAMAGSRILKILASWKFLAAVLAVVAISGALFWVEGLETGSEEKIGWITDIHAGGGGKRKISDWNTVYPIRFKEYLPRVLDRMKDDGVDYAISTGDQVNARNDDYAGKITKRIPSGINMFWVQGNHDSDDSMKKLGISKTYYSKETKSFKVIILDIEDEGVELGKDQEEWLKDEIENADLPVIMASHSPLYNFADSAVYPGYSEIEQMISGSGKVKYAISGHLHEDKEAVLNGVIYRSARPLTLKDNLGSYYEISLKEGIISKNMMDDPISKK